MHPSYFQRICNAGYVEDLTDTTYQVSLTLKGSRNRAQKLTYKSEASEIFTCFEIGSVVSSALQGPLEVAEMCVEC